MQQHIDIPVGRVEYLSQAVHLLKHEEKLLLVGRGKTDEPLVLSSTRGTSAAESRALLHAAVDLIFDVACKT